MKDLFSTLLTLTVAGITYGVYKGINLPYFQNTRVGLLIFIIVGFVMCASTGTPVNDMNKSPMILLATILGIGAFGIFIWGMVTGQKTALIALGIDIVLLWAVATVRHLVLK